MSDILRLGGLGDIADSMTPRLAIFWPVNHERKSLCESSLKHTPYNMFFCKLRKQFLKHKHTPPPCFPLCFFIVNTDGRGVATNWKACAKLCKHTSWIRAKTCHPPLLQLRKQWPLCTIHFVCLMYTKTSDIFKIH